MDRFEQKMKQASEELRQSTRNATPPLTQPVPLVSRPRWLAFAAGFAVVALAIGVLPTLLGESNPPVGGSDPTTPPPISQPQTPTTEGTAPVVECSSDGVPVPGSVEGLPGPIAQKRFDLINAAVACDFDGLEALAGPDFTIFFGAYGVEKFREWEEDGAGQLGTLLLLLGMTHGVIEYPDAPTEIPAHYVWPAAFAYDRWEDVPPNLVEELHALYTEGELDEFFGVFGSYAGWRTSIDADGVWRHFTSGD